MATGVVCGPAAQAVGRRVWGGQTAVPEQGCFIRTKAFDETRRDFGNCLTSRREAQGSTLAYTGADSESGASSSVDSGRLFAVLVGKGEGGGS